MLWYHNINSSAAINHDVCVYGSSCHGYLYLCLYLLCAEVPALCSCPRVIHGTCAFAWCHIIYMLPFCRKIGHFQPRLAEWIRQLGLRLLRNNELPTNCCDIIYLLHFCRQLDCVIVNCGASEKCSHWRIIHGKLTNDGQNFRGTSVTPTSLKVYRQNFPGTGIASMTLPSLELVDGHDNFPQNTVVWTVFITQ